MQSIGKAAYQSVKQFAAMAMHGQLASLSLKRIDWRCNAKSEV